MGVTLGPPCPCPCACPCANLDLPTLAAALPLPDPSIWAAAGSRCCLWPALSRPGADMGGLAGLGFFRMLPCMHACGWVSAPAACAGGLWQSGQGPPPLRWLAAAAEGHDGEARLGPSSCSRWLLTGMNATYAAADEAVRLIASNRHACNMCSSRCRQSGCSRGLQTGIKVCMVHVKQGLHMQQLHVALVHQIFSSSRVPLTQLGVHIKKWWS